MLDLTELKEAEKKATPAPWGRQGSRYTENLVARIRGVDLFGEYRSVACGDEADFIALSRNLCRPMIEEIEWLRTRRTHHSAVTLTLHEITKKKNEQLRTELAKARDSFRYIDSVRDRRCLDNNCTCAYDTASEALRSIDESGALK